MTASGSLYAAMIPATAVVEPKVSYFIEATDTLSNTSKLPEQGQAAPQVVVVAPGEDKTPPTIVHASPEETLPRGEAVTLTATITDASGIASATLLYRVKGATDFTSVAMTRGAGDTFLAVIPASATEVEAIEYYLQASDNKGNGAVSPTGAPGTLYELAFEKKGNPNDPPNPSDGGCGCGPSGASALPFASLIALLAFLPRRRRA